LRRYKRRARSIYNGRVVRQDADLDVAQPYGNIQLSVTRYFAVLRRAMTRELVEECHIRPDAIEWTTVLGYFRWLDKGAKPEYVGVTKLRMSSEDLQDQHPRFIERRYVDAIATCPVDLDSLAKSPDDPSCVTVDSFRVHMSMPLYMCLRALGRRLAADSDFVRQFRR